MFIARKVKHSYMFSVLRFRARNDVLQQVLGQLIPHSRHVTLQTVNRLLVVPVVRLGPPATTPLARLSSALAVGKQVPQLVVLARVRVVQPAVVKRVLKVGPQVGRLGDGWKPRRRLGRGRLARPLRAGTAARHRCSIRPRRALPRAAALVATERRSTTVVPLASVFARV